MLELQALNFLAAEVFTHLQQFHVILHVDSEAHICFATMSPRTILQLTHLEKKSAALRSFFVSTAQGAIVLQKCHGNPTHLSLRHGMVALRFRCRAMDKMDICILAALLVHLSPPIRRYSGTLHTHRNGRPSLDCSTI